MIIQSKLKKYSVKIENDFGFLTDLLKLDSAFFVVDKNLYEIYKSRIFNNLPQDRSLIIEALEENKTVDTALKICEAMTQIPAKRNARLVSFGGGIIQDVTGFAANILYRGINWTYVPTTLLAACDSCIGGKTSLNYKQFKNLLGTFYPPNDIHIYPEFFKTLTERDFQSGLGEVVKFNIMYGEKGLAGLEQDIGLLLDRDEQTINRYLDKSLAFKKPFVEEDEFDNGIRIHLNFAHTFGHAFETTSNYAIPHGTAVAMGMIVANRISLRRGMLDEGFIIRSENVLSRIINLDFSEIGFHFDLYMNAIRKDKKQTSTALTAVLLNNDMGLEIFKDLNEEEIIKALDSMSQCLKIKLY